MLSSGSATMKKRKLGVCPLVLGAVGGCVAAALWPPRRRGGSARCATTARASAGASGGPLPGTPLPSPLMALDGKAPGAPPEDIFTWDTVSTRMPKIMDSVLASLPSSLAKKASLLEGVRALQQEMRDGAELRPLEATSPWVNADAWNQELAPLINAKLGWHAAPWWIVENYMYKRLLEELGRCGPEAACYDPFEPQKRDALAAATGALGNSIRPLLDLIAAGEVAAPGSKSRRGALEAATLRSLWGNQADLSLSAGKVECTGSGGQMISDQTSAAVELFERAKGRPVIIVLDNHGLEVLCDLVFVDALLRVTEVSTVHLHVKDAPVFVSDVTKGDVPGILAWLEEHEAPLARRLQAYLADGRLQVVSDAFYTSARPFWELPSHLRQAYSDAAAVVLKGDANFRRLLGDLHWPYDTDFGTYARSFWPSAGLVSLRTMKSGVAIGISPAAQADAQAARPNDWLTSGFYGQVLVSGPGA